jgi:N-acetylmuramoyl-L-alanine amidase
MPWSRCGRIALLIFAGYIAICEIPATAATSSAPAQATPQQPPNPTQKQGAPVSRQPLPTVPPPTAAPIPPRSPAPPPPVPAARFVIVLDAAHGGDDLGGHLSSGQFEKNANLALSVRLRSLLGARGIQVVTTRESDQSIDLNRRAEIANHADARACISLHTADTGSGVHLFVSSLAPAAPTRFLAWKTAQAALVTRSLALAGVLNSALIHAGMTVTLGRTALPAIESMTCPAVAIELAPERDSDHKVTAAPDDPDYQARVAATLATALLEWRSQPSRTDAAPREARNP